MLSLLPIFIPLLGELLTTSGLETHVLSVLRVCYGDAITEVNGFLSSPKEVSVIFNRVLQEAEIFEPRKWCMYQ